MRCPKCDGEAEVWDNKRAAWVTCDMCEGEGEIEDEGE